MKMKSGFHGGSWKKIVGNVTVMKMKSGFVVGEVGVLARDEVHGWNEVMRTRGNRWQVKGRCRVKPMLVAAVEGDGVEEERRPGSRKGFVEEMRFVAMRLHTRDQAPREGTQEESALPISEWRPSLRDYLQFLVDSKLIYDFMEQTVASTDDPMLSEFRDTGLERSGPLADDIQWLETQNVPRCEPSAAAKKYVDYLTNLLESRQPAFLCHWYNYYFGRLDPQDVFSFSIQDDCDRLEPTLLFLLNPLDGHPTL
uniref:Uncharacterized protein n=1 Tax=Compsopogon caeruleus TaxID=31354 RepID=A0A7S1TKJ8_9RHOD|mmetsp:Transcript_9046/g.18278  ORF Transcript_9046/g.18278 Transcript_9046/m.18278 type:complete len:254 (+) Transcript_9046:1-762(+)